jgi:chemotaxis protein histidine kinase CheA
MADGNVQMITPPNRLKAKLGNRLPLDAAAIARAEAALANMSSQFGDWLNEELAKLEAKHKTAIAPGASADAMEDFYRTAHDLKGLGTTYGYPIVSQFAGSLCKLIDSPDARARASHNLLTAHVGAIIAAVRQKVTDSNHPIGAALLRELTAQVARFEAAD